MISLRLIVFLLSDNKHFFVGKWINVQWILVSRSRTVNFPYILPSPAGPRVSPYSSESPDQLPVGLLGQLVDCCNGIAEARVRIPYKSVNSFQAFFSLLHWKVATINNFDHLLHIISSPRSSYIQFSYWVFIGSTFSYNRLEARSLCTCSSTVDSNPDEETQETLFIPSSLCHWRKKKNIILTIWADWTNHGSAN